ncbi:MAG: DUF1653 domain-containing protein [Patescibacteria group bacterium]|nr:DUF1653 domain-containing protein [Patescibacteria group bacterium]
MKIKKGKYTHFKGNEYDLLGVAKHSETLEELVIYEPLYKSKLAKMWARPIDMFTGKKEVDGKKIPRFKYAGKLKHPRLEVHVAGICFDGDKCLVLKRATNKTLYPGLWECGGGKVEPGENFEEALIREIEEEAGIEIERLELLGTYTIPVPKLEQKKIPGIRFLCKIKSYLDQIEPKISKEHSEWKFVTEDELDKFEFIPGVKEEIKKAFHHIR